ncbi:hypothetical protein [Salmonella sp. s54412]|uniref:hypothetical protein n=1 Tax=Salmonella sp. s54412 TaxID=3160128 RepID=UPI003753FED2
MMATSKAEGPKAEAALTGFTVVVVILLVDAAGLAAGLALTDAATTAEVSLPIEAIEFTIKHNRRAKRILEDIMIDCELKTPTKLATEMFGERANRSKGITRLYSL